MSASETAPQGILSNPESKRDGHVRIDAPDSPLKEGPREPAPHPTQVTAPIVKFAIKDEIELLRSGIKNVHGEVLRSQGSAE